MGIMVSSKATSGFWAEVEITEGNIEPDHFYMRAFVDRFPNDLVGGSNRRNAVPRMALVDWGGSVLTETDIDGKKEFFRSRGWVREFFAMTAAKAGDMVRVEETAPYCYRVSLKRKHP